MAAAFPDREPSDTTSDAPMPVRERPGRAMAATAWCLGMLVFASCSAGGEPAVGPRNVLVISLDTLRADRLGSYGYDRETSPFLDELAGRGVRFSRAFVNTHATPPSHTTIMSGLHQETHRVALRHTEPEWRSYVVPRQVVLLQERLRAAGYRTVGVTEGGYMSKVFGWSRGFDEFDDSPRDVATSAQRLIAMLEARDPSGGPIFAFLHTYEVHLPYTPPAEYRASFSDYTGDWEATAEQLGTIRDAGPEGIQFLSDMYDAEIRYTDDVLRDLFARLEAMGFLEDALVVVTSDHGEEFAEHGGLSHSDTLYDELVHVPLFFVGRGLGPPRVDDRMVSHIDVVPTVLARLGLPPDPVVAGRDLFPSGGDGEDDRGSVVFQYADRLYGIRTPDWKLIETMRPARATELYDLRSDPAERENLAASRPDRVSELQSLLRQWQVSVRRLPDGPRHQAHGPAAGPGREETERLRALGYVH